MKAYARFGPGVLLVLTSAISAADPPRVNRLAKESSPYLRQHAHNPVDWHAWGPDAFARAHAENKLVFLSIGYSSCHWCHVMERESFSDADIARLLNESFVCIKVDREERPDIDQAYLTALQCCGINGGWPLSMFLTPQGKPIIGGTYWPPDDKTVNGQRLPGFKGVLRKVIALEKDKPRELREQADKVAELTRRALGQAKPGGPPVEPSRGLVDVAVEVLREGIDPQYGGFGNPRKDFRGPKFPSTPSLDLLWQVGARREELRKPVLTALSAMARGGIYDQIGGGFHRYSTERTWTVPHFEKMLYDNAQLVEQYAAAFAATREPLYRRIIDETLAFVRRDLTAPAGGFYSSLDADAEGEEGKIYVWTKDELAAALPDARDFALAARVWGFDQSPNFESRAFVLIRRESGAHDAEKLRAIRDRLKSVRDRRPQPFLDTKVLCGWNGEMIAAFADAGRVLGDSLYVSTAESAADFLLARMRTTNGRLAHGMAALPGEAPQARGAAFLDDYAFVIHGLLALHDATKSPRWLKEASALTEAAVEQFADPVGGGFFYTSADHDELFVRCKDQYDGAQPSGNSVMARNLLRLAAKTGESRYRELAAKSLRAFAPTLDQNPAGLSTMAAAMDLALETEPMNPLTAEPQKPAGSMPTRSEDVAKASFKADKPAADGKQTIRITLKIDKGWHVYANPIGNPDLESSETVVRASSKSKPLQIAVEYPKGKQVKDAIVGDYSVYSEEVVITAVVQRPASDTSAIDLAVKIQACNERKCLLPATLKLVVP